MLSKLQFYLFPFFLVFFFKTNGQTKLEESQIELVSKTKINYFLYYPEEYQKQTNNEFGILLFLHGSGSIPKNDSEKFLAPDLLTNGTKFPFLILVPQHLDANKMWNTYAVKQLLDSVVKTNRIDPKKIYLSGLSRGGVAAWDMVIEYPDTFAALAVVSSMAPTPYAHWMNKKMPIRVYHGENDKVIPVSEAEDMVERLKKMNYNVEFIKYKNRGHDIWDTVYNNLELYSWFNKQKKM
mgnify:CR=1 FL=1